MLEGHRVGREGGRSSLKKSALSHQWGRRREPFQVGDWHMVYLLRRDHIAPAADRSTWHPCGGRSKREGDGV